MTWKLIGSVFVIVSCGGFGFMTAAAHRKEVQTLIKLIHSLDYMEWELQYRMTHLSELCRQLINQNSGALKNIFMELAEQLELQSAPDVQHCMELILSRRKDVPSFTRTALYQLGRTLGKFDLDGQIKGIHSVREECRRNLEQLRSDQAVRIRSYQTLGLCAGTAMAILLF